ncbi:hypothetical protein [Actinotignum urinale]|uniref:hypothetical protein n=1 Tax=Actinotignum urinale TaxID=190146 RepID=UPI00370D7E89
MNQHFSTTADKQRAYPRKENRNLFAKTFARSTRCLPAQWRDGTSTRRFLTVLA